MILTESDIRYMVQETLKRLNEETADLESLIGGLPISKISDAFDLTFGKECNFFAGEPYATFNAASPEKQREFIDRLNGTYIDPSPAIELELDPNDF